MPQRNSRMVCPDWAKREQYGEPYITRQEYAPSEPHGEEEEGFF